MGQLPLLRQVPPPAPIAHQTFIARRGGSIGLLDLLLPPPLLLLTTTNFRRRPVTFGYRIQIIGTRSRAHAPDCPRSGSTTRPAAYTPELGLGSSRDTASSATTPSAAGPAAAAHGYVYTDTPNAVAQCPGRCMASPSSSAPHIAAPPDGAHPLPPDIPVGYVPRYNATQSRKFNLNFNLEVGRHEVMLRSCRRIIMMDVDVVTQTAWDALAAACPQLQMESNQSLRDRLTQINAQIALLEGEQKIIQKKLRSIIYPVLGLPFEVTSKIFVHCLPEDLEGSEPILGFPRGKPPTPLLLSQICRAWRYVALQTPKIWAMFNISLDHWLRNSAPVASTRLEYWMDRAGVVTCVPYVAQQIRHSYFIGDIAPINLGLRVHYRDLVTEQFQSALHRELPALETLQIKSEDPGTTIINAFEQAPKLRAVALDHLPPTLLLLPWSQLTHFRGEWCIGMDCYHVLRSAVSLVECKFTWVDQDMEETAPPPRHLALKALHLTGEYVCIHILSILTLPSLVELDFRDGNGYPYHEEFVSFLSRSRPSLLRLSLHGGAYSRIIHGFPFLLDLTTLKISEMSVAGILDFSHNLRVRDPAAFLPNLKSFACSVREPARNHLIKKIPVIQYGDVADALEFRSGYRLKSFELKLNRQSMRDQLDAYDDDYANNIRDLLAPPPNFRLKPSATPGFSRGGHAYFCDG
ncbi:hypothetical protein B0H14DRAFT_2598533 [Mycena olivaceomarginata]|nr:hypothetical protein B0H14DRAFT_2598533 [Mycena olivaceomarginata]